MYNQKIFLLVAVVLVVTANLSSSAEERVIPMMCLIPTGILI